LAAPEVVPSHRRELLSVAVWKYTEADAGKWGLQYRLAAVVNGPTASVQQEHVLPRKHLVERMLSDPGNVPDILATAQACLVTTTEHARLSALPASVLGWTRYFQAGIGVIDMLIGEPASVADSALERLGQPRPVRGARLRRSG
jgi:hypothetical protein